MFKQASMLNSLKWSVLGYILPQVASPVISIYIAYLLSPEAYGLVAIATIITSFLQMILANGFTSALIQKQGNTKDVYTSADFIFSFNLLLSFVFYLIIFFSSSEIAKFFHNPEAEHVVSILSISLIINAFGNVQLAILQKGMEFKSIFLRQIMPVSSQLVVTLPMALIGYGVWALVAGKLISDIIAAGILWWKSDWKPKFNFNFRKNIDIIKFGLYIMGSSIIAWLLIQGDNVIVGKFLSTKELGLYKTGFDFNSRIFNILIAPIIPVFYAKFCLLTTEEEIKKYYIKTKEYLSIIVFPLMGGVVLISPYFENLLLGEKWKGISFIMATLTIIGISRLWALLGNLFMSLGKPEIILKKGLIIVSAYIPLWLFFIQFGLKTFLIARIFISIISVSLNTYYEKKILKINLLRALQFYHKAFLAAVGMTAIGFFIQCFLFKNTYNVLSLITLIFICAVSYFLLIRSLAGKQIFYLKTMLVGERFNKLFGWV